MSFLTDIYVIKSKDGSKHEGKLMITIGLKQEMCNHVSLHAANEPMKELGKVHLMA